MDALRADVLPALGFGGALLAAVAFGEALRAWAGWRAESSRRVVHASVGVLVALCPPLFESPAPVYVLALAFIAVNLVAVPRQWLPGMHGIARRSWGTVTFPLALVLALWLCWTLDARRIFALQAAFLVLALADPIAAIVGTRVRNPGCYTLGGDPKSQAGTAAFAAAAFVLTAGALVVLKPDGFGPLQIVAGAFAAAGLGAAAEALGKTGWDNLAVVVAVLAPLGLLHTRPDAAGLVLVALVVAAGFSLLAWRARALDAGGAVGAGLLAWGVVAIGGAFSQGAPAAWAAPGLAFFVLSSALSRAGRRRKRAAEALAEKGHRRDAGQVLANGGVAGALLGLLPFLAPEGSLWMGLLYGGFVGAFGAAAADTWGTEIGTLVRGRTRSILNGSLVAPGTSGGVSLAGTAGALGGALSVAGAAWLAGGGSLADATAARFVPALVLAGLAGAILDSVLGATVQARYRDPATGGLTERPAGPDGTPHALAAGFSPLTNDRVNLACTAVGALVGALLIGR